VAYEREEFEKNQAERKKKEVKQRRSELGAMQREALAAEYVTGDEHWDLLLSIMMAKIKNLQGKIDEATEALKTSDEFSPEVLINQKLGVRLYGARVDELEWLISLPQILKEQGDRANELLGTIDESDD
jgi:formate dehydrogenase maturation protein FdhE